jgi:hypothetical protein
MQLSLLEVVRISKGYSPVQLWCLSPSWFPEGQEGPHKTPLTATRQKGFDILNSLIKYCKQRWQDYFIHMINIIHIQITCIESNKKSSFLVNFTPTLKKIHHWDEK